MTNLVKFGGSWVDPRKVIAVSVTEDNMRIHIRNRTIPCWCDLTQLEKDQQLSSIIKQSGRHYSKINGFLYIDPWEVVAISVQLDAENPDLFVVVFWTEQHKIRLVPGGSLILAEQARNAFSAIVCAERLMYPKDADS